MKKILLGLVLGLSFAGIQASLVDQEVLNYMNKNGVSYQQALEAVRGGNINTQASTSSTSSKRAVPIGSSGPVAYGKAQMRGSSTSSLPSRLNY